MTGRYLDWGKHKFGPPRPCVTCGGSAHCRDADGRPRHKVCAEKELNA